MRYVIAVLLSLFSTFSFARCYLGVGAVELKLDHLTTKFEDNISNSHISSSTSKDLTAQAEDVQFGCFVTKNISVSLGYVSGVKLGANTALIADFKIKDKQYAVLLPSIVREIEADVSKLGFTYYTGESTSLVRGFATINVIHARASYRVSAAYTDQRTGYEYSLSGLVRRQKTAAAPEVGLLLNLTGNSQVELGYGYYGPRAHQWKVGTRVYF